MKPSPAKPRRCIRLACLAAGCFACAPAAAGEQIYAAVGEGGSVVLTNVPVGEGFEVLVASEDAAPVMQAGAPARPPAPGTLFERARRLRGLVEQIAGAVRVDANLVHAVIAVESGYNARAVSPKGATGLMQLMPETARRFGVSDLTDPEQNVLAGARYLRALLEMFDNDIPLALAAYNAGENAVIRHGRRIPPFGETSAYVPKVLDQYRKFASAL